MAEKLVAVVFRLVDGGTITVRGADGLFNPKEVIAARLWCGLNGDTMIFINWDNVVGVTIEPIAEDDSRPAFEFGTTREKHRLQ